MEGELVKGNYFYSKASMKRFRLFSVSLNNHYRKLSSDNDIKNKIIPIYPEKLINNFQFDNKANIIQNTE